MNRINIDCLTQVISTINLYLLPQILNTTRPFFKILAFGYSALIATGLIQVALAASLYHVFGWFSEWLLVKYIFNLDCIGFVSKEFKFPISLRHTLVLNFIFEIIRFIVICREKQNKSGLILISNREKLGVSVFPAYRQACVFCPKKHIK